jgi:hypothetical protein
MVRLSITLAIAYLGRSATRRSGITSGISGLYRLTKLVTVSWPRIRFTFSEREPSEASWKRKLNQGCLDRSRELCKGLSMPRKYRVVSRSTCRASLQMIVSEGAASLLRDPMPEFPHLANFLYAPPYIPRDISRCHNSVPKILKPEA